MEKSISFRPVLINRFRRLKQYNLSEIITEFLVFRREVLTKQFNFRIDSLTRQKYINEIKVKVFDNIDFVIKAIRDSDTDEIAKQLIMTKLELTDEGAEYVLDLKLRQIKSIDKSQALEKIAELTPEIEKYLALLQLDTMNEYIIDELKWLKKKFNQKRETEVIGKQEVINLDSGLNTFEDKEVTILISPTWLIYKVSGRDIKIQNRRDDFTSQYGLEKELRCNNKDKIYFIQEGRSYSFNVWDIKDENAKPITIYNEKIQIWKVNEVIFTSSDSNKDLILIFENNNVNRVCLKDVIRSTQWSLFSTKKIKLSYITPFTSEELETNAEKYCFLRTTSEGNFMKHALSEINSKKSIWAWMSLKWETVFFNVLLDNEEYYINVTEEKLDLKMWKLRTRDQRGEKLSSPIKSLTLVSIIPEVLADDTLDISVTESEEIEQESEDTSSEDVEDSSSEEVVDE